MPVSLSKIKLNLIKIVSPSRIFENKFVASTEISLLNVKLVFVGRFRMYLRWKKKVVIKEHYSYKNLFKKQKDVKNDGKDKKNW